eukprot:207296-Prymnesium_polylepis.1
MRPDRRSAARWAAHAAAASAFQIPWATPASEVTLPAVAAAPSAIAVVAPGFLLSRENYGSYIDLLEELGICSVCMSDRSLTAPSTLEEGSQALLSQAEQEAARRGLPDDVPLVMVGHSRGAKLAVLAAAASTRPVAAMVLLDPVDATVWERDSAMTQLARLSVPTAVVGAAAAGDCAPLSGNFNTFYRTLEAAGAPRLLALLPSAGHMQFVDRRSALLDICPSGSDDDPSVHEVAMAVISAWLAAFVPGVGAPPTAAASSLGTGAASGSYLLLARAVACRSTGCLDALQGVRFRSHIDWLSGDLPQRK